MLSPPVQAFRSAAREDARQRLAAAPVVDVEAVLAWAKDAELQQLVMPYVPVGAAQDALAAPIRQWRASGLTVATQVREWDAAFWPHAAKGFSNCAAPFPTSCRICGLLKLVLLGVDDQLFARKQEANDRPQQQRDEKHRKAHEFGQIVLRCPGAAWDFEGQLRK